MKHIKEWHTCDRCGERIKKTLIDQGFAAIKLKEQQGYTPDVPMIKYNNFEIVLYTGKKDYELCPKCGKDFERFMKDG